MMDAHSGCCITCGCHMNKKVEKKTIINQLELYRTLNFSDEGNVDEAIRNFISLLEQAKSHSYDIEAVMLPFDFARVMNYFIKAAARQAKYLSEVFHAVYRCTIISKHYHKALYVNTGFWQILFSMILNLPDIQFYEAIMAYIAMLAQVCNQPSSSNDPNELEVVVESDDFHAPIIGLNQGIFTDIIQRLLHLQEQNLTSKVTIFSLDYKRILAGFFGNNPTPEFYIYEHNCPVESIAILLYCFISRPSVLQAIINDSNGVHVLLNVLKSKACKHMYMVLIFHFDLMISTSRRLNVHELYENLVEKLDFSLILNFAAHNADKDVRRVSQKIIMDLFLYKDHCCEDSIKVNYPHRNVLTAVSMSRLQVLITNGNHYDKCFGFIIIAESLHKEEKRDLVIKKGIPKEVVKYLCQMLLSCTSDNLGIEIVLRGIEAALFVLMRIAHANEIRQRRLYEINAVDVTGKFILCNNENIRSVAKETVMNLTGRIIDAQVQLFKILKYKDLVHDAYEYQQRYLREKVSKTEYFKRMHLNLALLRQELSVNFYLTKGNGADTSYLDISPGSCNKMMQIFTYCIMDNKKVLPPTFSMLSIASISYLLVMENVDVEKHLTDDLLAIVFNLYEDEESKAFLNQGNNFKEIFQQKYPQRKVFSYLKGNDQESVKKKNFGTKCAWPPCLNYGVNKYNKDSISSSKPLKKCGNCRAVSYCGTGCQKLHWKEHKKVCLPEKK